MFEDLEEEENVDVSADSPDRVIIYAIWKKSESLNLTPEEAWAILHERYPEDARFLLLNAYAELAEPTVAGAWTPSYFVKKVERILAAATEEQKLHVKDLLAFGGAVMASAKGEDAKAFLDLRTRVGVEAAPDGKRDERAGLKLRRYEREVLKELHERTLNGSPLGVRSVPTPHAPPVDEWGTAVADTSKPRRRYAADAAYARGELVEHAKFGVGVVTGIEPGRVQILFEGGARKLVAR
jgi:hypothetical protein